MELPPLPPADDVFTALKLTVLPAAGAAAFVYALFLSAGRWAGLFGSAVAVLAGLAYANWLELRLPWNPERVAWEWLPRAAAAMVLIGLVSRCIGFGMDRLVGTGRWWWLANGFVWLPRVGVAIVVAFWLVPERVREPEPWLLSTFAATMLLEWIILDGVARGGRGVSVAFSQAMMLLGCSAVILYSHSARFMEVSTVAGAALFGIGVVARVARTTGLSGCIPAGVVLLPGLILSTKLGTESHVPAAAYYLVALAPLGLAPWLIPALARRRGWVSTAFQLAAVAVPIAIAVILAGQSETLPWEEEW